MVGAAALLVVGTLACTGRPAPVTWYAVAEDDAPIADLEIAVLPFDPDAILDSLAAAAPRPRPIVGDLEERIRTYHAPDADSLAAAAAPWRALRDSLVALADSLNTMGRGAAAYGRLFRRFREAQPRLAGLAARRDSVLDRLIADQRALAERAGAAADSLRAWEEVAFAPYPALAEAALARSGRAAFTVRTDSTGTARAELTAGRWWAVARRPDPVNVFVEHAWTLPFTTTGWLPLQIPLLPQNAERRWRH
jgi:hypothetical protein